MIYYNNFYGNYANDILDFDIIISTNLDSRSMFKRNLVLVSCSRYYCFIIVSVDYINIEPETSSVVTE